MLQWQSLQSRLFLGKLSNHEADLRVVQIQIRKDVDVADTFKEVRLTSHLGASVPQDTRVVRDGEIMQKVVVPIPSFLPPPDAFALKSRSIQF